MIDQDRIELEPVRSMLLAGGGVHLAGNLVGLAVLLPIAQRRTVLLGVFGICSLIFGLLSWGSWRYALRRVMAPPPAHALIAPSGRMRRLLVSSAVTVAIVVFSVVTRNPFLLGIGFGSGVGMLLAAKKIGQFERDDGRRLLRTRKRGFGGAVTLYAGP